MNKHLVHIPTPGDHYSPRTGSAVMTVIYELSRVHAAAGGETTIVLRNGATEGYEPYSVGTVVEVALGDLPDRRRKALDVVRGAMGLSRRGAISAYAGSIDAVPSSLDGFVVVHNAPGVIPSLARARPSVPICLYAHNALFRTYTRRQARRVVDAAHRVLCVSDFVAEGLRGKIGRDDDRIRTVRNGVDAAAFVPGPPSTSTRAPVVLFLGRVIPEKGPDLLVRAAVLLHAAGMRFRLRIVGSSGFSATDSLSQYELRLREIAASLGRCVEFLPFQERVFVPDVYGDADVFCAPSTFDEPFPLCVLEAMASGLPSVVSKRGGIPEAGGDAVLYFEPPDHVELAEALEQLLANEQLRRRMGELARQRAEQLSWANSYRGLTAALCA